MALSQSCRAAGGTCGYWRCYAFKYVLMVLVLLKEIKLTSWDPSSQRLVMSPSEADCAEADLSSIEKKISTSRDSRSSSVERRCADGSRPQAPLTILHRNRGQVDALVTLVLGQKMAGSSTAIS